MPFQEKCATCSTPMVHVRGRWEIEGHWECPECGGVELMDQRHICQKCGETMKGVRGVFDLDTHPECPGCGPEKR